MTQQPQSVSDDSSPVDERVSGALSAVLRRAASEGKTDEALESDTGVNRYTIKAYRLGTRKPSMAAGLMIVSGIGEWAVNRLLNIIRYQATSLDEVDALQPTQIVANAVSHLGVIARAAADGRIDHTEQPETTEAADMLIATVLPLSTAGRI